MARGKLILICQFGGDVAKKEDGLLSYVGGDAEALYIFNDTLFSDLDIKLAEICNIEYSSMTIKYVLPGNKQVLISLSNDKDLERMLAFHNNSVTADVFVFGNEGFDRDALKSDLSRTSRIKQAEMVDCSPRPPMMVDDRTSLSNDDLVFSAAVDDHEKPSHIGDDTERPGIFPSTSATGTVKRKRRNEADGSIKLTKRKKSRNGSTTTTGNVEEHREFFNCEQNEVDIKKFVAAWKEGIDGPGQEFNNANEFRDTLQKYAIAHRFTYKFKKNDDNRVNGRCTAEGCSWKIHAAWVPQTQSFRIKKMNKTHTCGGESWKNANFAKNWLIDIIAKRLHITPNYKPKDIANDIARDFGIELKYPQIRRWVKDAKTQLVGPPKEDAYQQLLSLGAKMVKMNPDSVVILSKSNDNTCQRFFLSFHSIIHGFQKGCRPLLFLDSTSLRSECKESLLVASTIDGNDKFFPVAIAVVDVENDDAWLWFLNQLKTVVSISATITFISDQDTCLQEIVPRVFENVEQGYSMHHFIESFKKNLKGVTYQEDSDSLLDSLMDSALTYNFDAFNSSMDHIKKVSPSSHDWLQNIDPSYWANSQFEGERYNHITENSVKSLIELLEGAKELPLSEKVEAIAQMMENLMSSRRNESKYWNLKLTPSKEEWLGVETFKASNLQVLFSSESVFQVRDDTIYIVDLKTWECSCRGWGKTGMPCCHAIAVFKHTGRNVYDFCSKYFSVESFKLTYCNSINSVPGKADDEEVNAEDAGVVQPKLTSRPLNQEKMKRTRRKSYVCDKTDDEEESAEDAGIVQPKLTSRPPNQKKMKRTRRKSYVCGKADDEEESAEDAGTVQPKLTSRPLKQVKKKRTSRRKNYVCGKAHDEEENAEDAGVVQPKVTSRPPNQEKMKQTISKRARKRVAHCSRCKKQGHYKATCKADV